MLLCATYNHIKSWIECHNFAWENQMLDAVTSGLELNCITINAWNRDVRKLKKIPCSSTTGSADTLLSTKIERASWSVAVSRTVAMFLNVPIPSSWIGLLMNAGLGILSSWKHSWCTDYSTKTHMNIWLNECVTWIEVCSQICGGIWGFFCGSGCARHFQTLDQWRAACGSYIWVRNR